MATEKTFTYTQLALMDWMMEKPGRRFATHMTVGTGGFDLWELGEEDANGKQPVTKILSQWNSGKDSEVLIKRLGIKRTLDLSKLHSAGFLTSLNGLTNRQSREKFIARLKQNPFHYSDAIDLPTRQAREWWAQTGKSDFERERGRREDNERKATRLVLIGQRAVVSPTLTDTLRKAEQLGLKLPDLRQYLVRPYAVARVVRETGTRLYVEDVEVIADVRGFDSRKPSISGFSPNQFVDKTSVMIDGVTKAEAHAILDLDAEYASDLSGILNDTINRVAPILIEASSRLAQKRAEREDMLKERIEAISGKPKARTGKRIANTPDESDEPQGSGPGL